MIKFILLTIITLILTSCGDPDCIDASDFGEPKFLLGPKGEDVSAKIEDNETMDFLQITNSTYTGYSLNGEDLIVIVSGAWSPWSNQELKNPSYSCHSDYISSSSTTVNQRVCKENIGFIASTAGEYNGHKYEQNKKCNNGTNQNFICWFPYGWGIMIGFSKDQSPVNEVLYHMGPKMTTNSMSKKKEFRLPKSALTDIKKKLGVEDWGSIKVFLRVHDNNYKDNINGCIKKDISGSYPKTDPTDGDIYQCAKPIQFKFTSGIRNDEAGFLQKAAQMFIEPSEELIYYAYNAFIKSDTYKNIFYICSVLFVILIPLGFFTAYIQLSMQQVIVLIIRFAIISSLLSPSGWEVFDKYVKTFFWNGSSELAKLIVDTTNLSTTESEAVAIEIGDNIDDNILAEADDSIEMLFSGAVNGKIMSLIFSHKFGILIVIALYFAFFVYIFAVLKLAVILIFLFIALSILMALAPIFIIFALFQYTREQYFEKWLQSLISVALQPMMLFTFFGMFMAVINTYLYNMLYFEACWKTLINLLIIHIKFWKVNKAFGPPDPETGIRPELDGEPNIEFIDILLLFLSAMVIRYVTDKVPEISEKIAGGFSLGAISSITNTALSGIERAGEEFAKLTAGNIWERTAGRGLASAMDKFAPTIISKNANKMSLGLINKTKAEQLSSAKRKVTANLKSKGWTQKDIDQAMRSGKLNKKLSNEMIKDKAKEKRYGTKSYNPAKVALGAIRQVKDNLSTSVAIASRGKISSKQKQQLKDMHLEPQIKKIRSDSKQKTMQKIDQKAENLIDEKFGKNDLKDIAKSIKNEMKDNDEEINNFSDKDRINSDIKDRMIEMGYDKDDADRLMDKYEDDLDKLFGDDYKYVDQDDD